MDLETETEPKGAVVVPRAYSDENVRFNGLITDIERETRAPAHILRYLSQLLIARGVAKALHITDQLQQVSE